MYRFSELLKVFLVLMISYSAIDKANAQQIGLEVNSENLVLFGDSLAGAGSKFMWLPAKAALRAGEIEGKQWNGDSIGIHSVAFGNNNIAKGEHSMAWGLSNKVSDRGASVWGTNNTTEGEYNSVWGLDNVVKGRWSTIWGKGNNVDTTAAFYSTIWGENNSNLAPGATIWGVRNTVLEKGALSTVSGNGNTVNAIHAKVWGNNNVGNGPYSTIWGNRNSTDASGEYSTVWGYDCSSTQDRGTAWGWQCTAGAEDATAFGLDNYVEGKAGVVMGDGNVSRGYAAVTIGRYNKSILDQGMTEIPGSGIDYPLFTIGNGGDTNVGDQMIRSNALLVSLSGRTLIGDGEMPLADLHIKTSSLHRSDSISTGGILLEAPGANNSTWQVDIGIDGALVFSSNNVEKARLDSNGVLYVTSVVESAGMIAKNSQVNSKEKLMSLTESQLQLSVKRFQKELELLRSEVDALRNE